MGLLPEDELVATTQRDGYLDCAHRACAAGIDRDGRPKWAIGDPHRLVFERSTTKPLHALACLRSGAAEKFDLTDAEIALIAGSHSGTAAHAARADELLNRIGHSENDILSPPRLPLGDDGLLQIATDGGLRKVHGECSGEHIGALATCLALGLPHAGYCDPAHPLQELYRSLIAEFSPDGDKPPIQVLDRCGMPTGVTSLAALATRFSRLTGARDRDVLVDRLLTAIGSHPRVYTGHGRLVGDVIEASQGRIVGKCGAEGLYVFSWLENGLSIAVKVSDGGHRAAVPALEAGAAAMDLPWPLDPHAAEAGEFATVTSALSSEGTCSGGVRR